MTAALSASRRGAKVVLLEQHPRAGRKLLATGNGRCNLMNASDPAGRYFGGGADAAVGLLRRYTYERLRDHWESLGLICREERDGRVYPASGRAASVVDVLRSRVSGAGVELTTGRAVTDILREPGGFAVRFDGGEVRADRVVIATGGKAAVNDGDATGYALLGRLGVPVTELSPALAPIRVEPSDIRGLKGVRVRAALTLARGGKEIASEMGEILFSDGYVSGIAAMGLARHVTRGDGRAVGDDRPRELRVDLMPERSADEWRRWFESRVYASGESAQDVLRGLVHPGIARRLLAAVHADATSAAIDAPWGGIGRMLRDWRLRVTGVGGFRDAQATAGGAGLEAFDGETLECKAVPGLFAAGETLDIDGACGGFNLMWAWASGIAAGEAAAR
jgi:predicted Rossmann fold flavoprotein